MKKVSQIRIAGFGGQGVVLIGTILGHAAVRDGNWVSGSNAYGAQARGGSARSEVVIAREPVRFPHVMKADMLIVMSQGAYDQSVSDLSRQNAVVIYDDLLIRPEDLPDAIQYPVPATDTALKTFENNQVANVIILGAAASITQIVSLEALESAVAENVSDRFKEQNLKALRTGYDMGEKILSGRE
ncbi:MAG: 2-oxoacid:acceptor oxidoreductase family protein [Deltaproteobacteria bacterium]|nr:2-oxoacid:acceptor oxidoreductase family protein [Deltaproteobacteria bacterium]